MEKSMKKSPKDKLVGTWLQVSLDAVSAQGTRRPLYGENAKGMIIYTGDGYFTLVQASTDLPKLKSGHPPVTESSVALPPGAAWGQCQKAI